MNIGYYIHVVCSSRSSTFQSDPNHLVCYAKICLHIRFEMLCVGIVEKPVAEGLERR